MRSRFLAIASILLLEASLAVEVPGQSGSEYLPKGPGVIDGNSAIVVLPGIYEDDILARYLDPAGLEVRLAATDESGVELTYPAGAWFVPPKGRYYMWLQGGWQMSPFSRVVFWGPVTGTAGRTSHATVVPAGLAKLPPDLKLSPGLDLHLLHAGNYLDGDFARLEISVRKAVAEVGEGVLMPEGKAVGALWDRKGRRYVAVSRPFEVRERRTVEIPLREPGAAADLVVQLTRKTMALRTPDMEVKLAVRQQGVDRPADLAVFTAERVYGYWYDLPAGAAELIAEHREDILPAKAIQLQAGKVERVTAEMQTRPALEVQLDLPRALLHENPVLEVRQLPSGEVLERRAPKPESGMERFEKLPAAPLRVDLQTAIGAFSRQADLSSGRDGFLLLKPDMITLTGRVFHGDEGHAAKLTFANAARETKVESEDDGRYEAVFLEAVQTVSIQLAGVEQEPYFDFFRPAIAASQELDFRLAAGDFRVRVLDAATGKGIAGAAVEIRNNYTPEEPKEPREASAKTEGRRSAGPRAVFQRVKTGETGEARLPPLRPGSVEMRASADGYAKMREATKAEIPDENTDRRFELRLEPIGETVAVRLRLPNGAPASNAQILLLRTLAEGEEVFSGRADGEGVVEVPRGQGGVLLIKHPAAAVSVRDWQPRPEDAESAAEGAAPEWTLAAPADHPLTILVKDPAGKQGVARADLALWLDGRRLSGRTLGWLMGGPPSTDQNGFWTGGNLPRTALSILAWSPEARSGGTTGALDAQAIAVTHPWTRVIEVKAVQ